MFEGLENLQEKTKTFFLELLSTEKDWQQFPSGTYIYFLLDETKKGNKIVYIGQTTDIFSRLGRHGHKKVFTHCAYRFVPENVDIDILERALIEHFQPIYNKQFNDEKENEEEFPTKLKVIDEAFRSKYDPFKKEILDLAERYEGLIQKYMDLIK